LITSTSSKVKGHVVGSLGPNIQYKANQIIEVMLNRPVANTISDLFNRSCSVSVGLTPALRKRSANDRAAGGGVVWFM